MSEGLPAAKGDIESRLEALEATLEEWKKGNSNIGKEAASAIASELAAARPASKPRYESLLGFEIEDDE